MPDKPQLYIGLISGTSIDGIDAALVEFPGAFSAGLAPSHSPKLIDSLSLPYPNHLQTQLHQLCQAASYKTHTETDSETKAETSSEIASETESMGNADIAVAQAFSEAVSTLLARNQLAPNDIVAIGSHGQTIRHLPNAALPFTLQIGDPNTLASLTGIDVIADFRRKDMALGGQGAPLVPAFHADVFRDSSQQKNRAVINIGGIANITWLPADAQQPVLGFDTGPGNRLMDAWITRHQNKKFDENGQWAATGTVNQPLLTQLMLHPFLHQPFPKSTGREVFHLQWLDEQLAAAQQASHSISIPPENVQHTLLEFTVQSIALHLQQLIANQNMPGQHSNEVYVCGGGALNNTLMQRLTEIGQQAQTSYKVRSTDDLGVDPNMVEAMAFAWLAFAFQHRIPGNVPSVTGASRPAILGGWFPAL